MRQTYGSVKLLGLVCGMVVIGGGSASAEIVGFNSLNPVDWRYNQGDGGTPPVIINSDSIHFTTGPDNRRSLWYTAAQDISEFVTTFTYRAGNFGCCGSQGLAFVIQDSAAELSALGGTTGYGGIPHSAAVTIQDGNGLGFYTNGVLGGGAMPTSPVNAFGMQDIDVTITYSGSILSVLMEQGADVFGPQNYFVNSLPATIGSSTAYVGFTTSTGGGNNQSFLSNFRFAAVPEPSSLALLSLAGLALLRRRASRLRQV